MLWIGNISIVYSRRNYHTMVRRSNWGASSISLGCACIRIKLCMRRCTMGDIWYIEALHVISQLGGGTVVKPTEWQKVTAIAFSVNPVKTENGKELLCCWLYIQIKKNSYSFTEWRKQKKWKANGLQQFAEPTEIQAPIRVAFRLCLVQWFSILVQKYHCPADFSVYTNYSTPDPTNPL